MYLEHIEINNFRSLTAFSMDLKPGMNIIIGDNGSGKTSLIEAIATGLSGLVYHISRSNARNIKVRDIRRIYEPAGDISYTEKYSTPVTITTSAVIDGETHTWTRKRTSEQPNAKTGMSGVSISKWSKKVIEEPSALPLISYRKATALGVPDREMRGKKLMQSIERKTGYRKALEGQVFDDIYSWLFRLESMSSKSQEAREYQLFREFIGKVMKQMNELSDAPAIAFDPTIMRILYGEDGQMKPIESLSAGYYWILWMFMDLAARSLILNPQLERVEDIKGIVLIDEIDLHLHPKWQWNILPTLQEVLPKVQFIVTTHAPIIISSAKDANIIRIGDLSDIDYLGDAYAYSIRDVVELTQGSNGVLPKLKDTYYAFEEAFRRKDYDLARTYEEALRTSFSNSTEAGKAKLKLQMLKMKGV